VQLLLDSLQLVLLAWGMAALYRYVPNTRVRWAHAWVGGLFVAVGFEVAKKLLVVYLAMVPTYSVLYGAFATLPIMLVWIFMGWVIVLLGAVITAYLPSLLSGVQRRVSAQGWQFLLALEILQQLAPLRSSPAKGLTMSGLAQCLQLDALQLEPVLEALVELDWVGQLQEEREGAEARYVLLADPDTTLLAPLLQSLLLPHEASTLNLWNSGRWALMTMRDAL
jgi:membrane protein